jgi:predicted phage terminase large subunit-like protein
MNFKFQISQWAECILPVPPTPPYPPLRMAVDPAYFSNDTSDRSSYSLGWLSDEDGSFTLLDCQSGRWKGIALPEKIVDAIDIWRPEQLWVERSGNGAPDLLVDNINMLAETKGLATRISFFSPKSPKINRVFKLQAVIESDHLHISPGSWNSTLLQQARDFDFSRKDNHRHEDGMLDSLASVCGFRF